jgi:uncharacterized protein with GYD domain
MKSMIGDAVQNASTAAQAIKGRTIMLKMIYLVNYAQQGCSGLMQDWDREPALRKRFEAVGGKLISIAFTHGLFDLVVRVEMPDMNAAHAALTVARASGMVSGGVVLQEVDMAAAMALANKAAALEKPQG